MIIQGEDLPGSGQENQDASLGSPTLLPLPAPLLLSLKIPLTPFGGSDLLGRVRSFFQYGWEGDFRCS